MGHRADAATSLADKLGGKLKFSTTSTGDEGSDQDEEESALAAGEATGSNGFQPIEALAVGVVAAGLLGMMAFTIRRIRPC